MGIPGFKYYGEDIGSAVQDAERSIEKIKTNLFDVADVRKLAAAAHTLVDYALDKIDEDDK